MEVADDRESILSLVQKNAKRYDIDPNLMSAIIEIESAWNPLVVRFEEFSTSSVVPDQFARINGITVSTERILQKMSWGLGQIMGSTARFMGFQGPLTALLLPDKNLFWMGRYLAKLQADFSLVTDVISSYNAGSPRRDKDGAYRNHVYVDKVSSALLRLKK